METCNLYVGDDKLIYLPFNRGNHLNGNISQVVRAFKGFQITFPLTGEII
jgi:hypothetical protein